MDFVTHLLETKKKNNAIIAIVYRLSKRRILKPVQASELGTSVEAIAKLVYLLIRRQGISIINSFVSD